MGSNESGRKLKTVDMAMEILDTLHELDGARVTELAEHLNLPPSTVHGYLTTMQQNRYLVKEGDRYHVGLMFLNKGEYARRRKKAYRLAIERVNELAQETSEKVQFIVEEHGRGVYLHSSRGDHAVNIDTEIKIGSYNDLHVSAAGKAILAHLPMDDLQDIINRTTLTRFTENTITDPDELRAELETIRKNGYSFAKEEFLDGLRAVGVPVQHQNGQVIGGLSVSGPTQRLQGSWLESELPELLLGAANELELNIAYANS